MPLDPKWGSFHVTGKSCLDCQCKDAQIHPKTKPILCELAAFKVIMEYLEFRKPGKLADYLSLCHKKVR